MDDLVRLKAVEEDLLSSLTPELRKMMEQQFGRIEAAKAKAVENIAKLVFGTSETEADTGVLRCSVGEMRNALRFAFEAGGDFYMGEVQGAQGPLL